MPVTTRLSHRLHDALGEDAGGDLVTWMQTVDANRAELRELNELNFARIESRFRENEARLDTRFAQVEKLIEHQHSRLLLWSFSFWATALAALYAFTR